MKIIITEEQYENLLQSNLFPELTESYLNLLCKQSRKKGVNPQYCELYELEKNEKISSELRTELSNSIKVLYNFFRFKQAGILPKIVELSLIDKNRTITFLKLISDFITDESYNNDETKKMLYRLKNEKNAPSNIEELLRKIREKEYVKYENEFIGDNFGVKRTRLELEYKCGDNIDVKLIQLIKDVKSNKVELLEFLDNIKKCIKTSLNNPQPIKSDIISKTPLYYIENGEKIKKFDQDSLFEVKMMDTEIDSYLSEFFSIFKQSNVAHLKPEYLEVYNKIINGIFNWIKVEGNDYLENIKKQLSGIFFEKNQLIPIEYIELYWSNQGQRNCKELRLSVRFRINPKFNEIESFTYNKNSDILEKHTKKITKSDSDYIICK